MPVQQQFVGAGEGLNWETLGTSVVILKSITLEHDSLLASIGAYVRHPSPAFDDQVHNLAVAVLDANGLIVGGNNTPWPSVLFDSAPGELGDDTPRWYQVPVGAWLEAGEYYLAIQQHRSPASLQIAYDDGGTDLSYAPGGPWFSDLGWYAVAVTGRSYSIRASVVR